MAEACRRLATPTRSVVATLGASGALYAHAGDVRVQRAPAIDVVDSVGAGDAFTGVLAVALDRGNAFTDAIRQAVAAGTLACLAAGAQDSLPSRAAVDRTVGELPG